MVFSAKKRKFKEFIIATNNAVNLKSAGVVGYDAAGAFVANAVTQHCVQIGGATSSALVSVTNGTTGQFLGANTGAAPTWQTPAGGSAGTITGDSGGALSQSGGNWNILGTANQITTTGSGATLTHSLPSAITAPGSLTTTTTLTATTLFTALAGQVVNRTATATSMSVASTDYIIAVTSTAAVRTITLLASPTTNQVFVIKDESGAASINNISITVSGGSITIDGQTTVKINTNYGAIAVYFNGTNYFIL